MGELRASVTTDNGGWFKAVSPAFLELIGGPVESLAGVNLVDLVHPLDAPTMRQLLAHVPISGASATFTARVFAAGDVWRSCSVDARPAPDDRITVEFTTAHDSSQAAATTSAAAPAVSVWSVASALSFEEALEAPAGSAAGDQVPDQRVAVRLLVESAAVLEIDSDGRTTFSKGPWTELSEHGNDGAAAFEELLDRTGTDAVVLDLVETVTTTGVARQVEAPMLAGSRWIQILPIPSPYRADQLHALIAVTDAKAEGERVAGVVAAPKPDHFTSPAAAVTPATPAASDAEPEPDDSPNLVALPATELDQVAASDTADSAPATDLASGGPTDPSVKKGRGFFGWLVIGIAGLLAIVLISKLWPSGDDMADTGPVEVTISPTNAVEVQPGQSWRPTGAASVGESHGIAVTPSGAYLAGVNGTIVRLDADAGAISAVSLGTPETTFVSDIVADDSGTVWVLDAGEGRLFRISGDDSVAQVATDAIPLRNARGIGISADGDAWIASTASAQLVKIAADGAVTNSIPLPGRQASDVIEAPDGTLWIVDAQDLELVHLSLTGEVLGTVKDETLIFTSPTSPHLTIVDNSLWVTDPEQSAVFEIDLTTGQATGDRIVLSRPDDVRINKPIGIASDEAGRLWIADSTGVATTIVDQ